MRVTVKVFAHLRERLGFDQREVELAGTATVRDLWQQLTGEETVPRHVLCAVNLDYVPADTAIGEGDEVAFFPPVTGG